MADRHSTARGEGSRSPFTQMLTTVPSPFGRKDLGGLIQASRQSVGTGASVRLLFVGKVHMGEQCSEKAGSQVLRAQ